VLDFLFRPMSIPEFAYTVLLKPRPLRRLANRLLRSFLPEKAHVRGATVFLNPADPVISTAVALGVYEDWEIDFFVRNSKPGQTFVDVGTNVGLYTGLALKSADAETRIVCVEPHEESISYLEKTIAANRNPEKAAQVIVCRCAASDREGTAVLYENTENKGDNRLYPDPLCAAERSVKTRTLDSICREHGISGIDILKIDVQGHEARVLRGAVAVLSNSARCILMMEFWPQGLRCSGCPPEEVFNEIVSAGFKLYKPVRGRLEPIEDDAQLVRNNPGRNYANVVGLKGLSVTDVSIP
jgi:FkbM family methyltransferase